MSDTRQYDPMQGQGQGLKCAKMAAFKGNLLWQSPLCM